MTAACNYECTYPFNAMALVNACPGNLGIVAHSSSPTDDGRRGFSLVRWCLYMSWVDKLCSVSLGCSCVSCGQVATVVASDRIYQPLNPVATRESSRAVTASASAFIVTSEGITTTASNNADIITLDVVRLCEHRLYCTCRSYCRVFMWHVATARFHRRA